MLPWYLIHNCMFLHSTSVLSFHIDVVLTLFYLRLQLVSWIVPVTLDGGIHTHTHTHIFRTSYMILEKNDMMKGGWRLIHFLQLRRFLRSLEGSTNTGGSPKCFTLPHALWSCYTTKHKEWHKLGNGSSLAFWVVKTVDGAITSTWLVVLSQKSIDVWNSYGQLLVRQGFSYDDCLIYYTFYKHYTQYHDLSR